MSDSWADAEDANWIFGLIWMSLSKTYCLLGADSGVPGARRDCSYLGYYRFIFVTTRESGAPSSIFKNVSGQNLQQMRTT